MKDSYGRKIEYLRISLTELCNLRCQYCMPAEGIAQKAHEEMLTEEELMVFLKICASRGVRKIRLTGGEPLVKKNILSICEKTANLTGIDEVCLTTNGVLLEKKAKDLKQAGVHRLNISLDTLNPEKFARITRVGDFHQVWRGIEKSLECGFQKIKLNTVLMGNVNDDEIEDLVKLTFMYPIEVRFIEWMPMGCAREMKKVEFLPVSIVTKRIPQLKKIDNNGGVASLYRLDGALGEVGLISPVSNHFCAACNRLRLTADGYIKPCLHLPAEFSIKGKTSIEMEAILDTVLQNKPEKHEELSKEHESNAGRHMYAIGG